MNSVFADPRLTSLDGATELVLLVFLMDWPPKVTEHETQGRSPRPFPHL